MKDQETKNMGRDVFISYASDKGDSTGSRDREAADKIYTALETRGIHCWAAHRDILPGDDWLDSIISAVEKSKVLVLVFSANANHSKWVKDEITMALDENVKIIPFRIDDVSPRGGLKILKYRCQWLDAFKLSMEEHIEELVNVVCQHLGKEAKTSEKGKVNKQTQPPKEKIPGEVKSVESKAQKIYTNEKGFREADYGDGIKMVFIPEGEFTMGSNDYDNEKPIHTVYLDGYWMGKTEVTVGQFRLFVEAEGYKTDAEKGRGAYTWTGDKWEKKEGINWKNPGFKQDDTHPVVCVSWNDAKTFCDWLSNKKKLSFKLPTEAQWEKAARGRSGIKYPWGNHEPYYKGKWYANYAAHDSWEKRGEDGFEFTAPMGSYPQGASPYGLLDMAGNVWEWCRDWSEDDYYKKSPKGNPPGPTNGDYRVVRGGGWLGHAENLRCADRFYDRPSNRNYFLGFRLCKDNRKPLE